MFFVSHKAKNVFISCGLYYESSSVPSNTKATTLYVGTLRWVPYICYFTGSLQFCEGDAIQPRTPSLPISKEKSETRRG